MASDKQREEQERMSFEEAEVIVHGKEHTRKPRSRLVKSLLWLFDLDNVDDVPRYIRDDVLKPNVKRMVQGTVSDTFGIEFRNKTPDRKTKPSDQISYRKYYDDHDDGYSSQYRRAGEEAFYKPISYPTFGEAEVIRRYLIDMIEDNEHATIAHYYSRSGIRDFNHLYNNFGWNRSHLNELRDISPRRLRNGEYVLDMPKVVEFKNG